MMIFLNGMKEVKLNYVEGKEADGKGTLFSYETKQQEFTRS